MSKRLLVLLAITLSSCTVINSYGSVTAYDTGSEVVITNNLTVPLTQVTLALTGEDARFKVTGITGEDGKAIKDAKCSIREESLNIWGCVFSSAIKSYAKIQHVGNLSTGNMFAYDSGGKFYPANVSK